MTTTIEQRTAADRETLAKREGLDLEAGLARLRAQKQKRDHDACDAERLAGCETAWRWILRDGSDAHYIDLLRLKHFTDDTADWQLSITGRMVFDVIDVDDFLPSSEEDVVAWWHKVLDIHSDSQEADLDPHFVVGFVIGALEILAKV